MAELGELPHTVPEPVDLTGARASMTALSFRAPSTQDVVVEFVAFATAAGSPAHEADRHPRLSVLAADGTVVATGAPGVTGGGAALPAGVGPVATCRVAPGTYYVVLETSANPLFDPSLSGAIRGYVVAGPSGGGETPIAGRLRLVPERPLAGIALNLELIGGPELARGAYAWGLRTPLSGSYLRACGSRAVVVLPAGTHRVSVTDLANGATVEYPVEMAEPDPEAVQNPWSELGFDEATEVALGTFQGPDPTLRFDPMATAELEAALRYAYRIPPPTPWDDGEPLGWHLYGSWATVGVFGGLLAVVPPYGGEMEWYAVAGDPLGIMCRQRAREVAQSGLGQIEWQGETYVLDPGGGQFQDGPDAAMEPVGELGGHPAYLRPAAQDIYLDTGRVLLHYVRPADEPG